MKKLVLLVSVLSIVTWDIFPQKVIADHTAVSKYNDIPQSYIDKIKTMWVSFPGESHSQAYRTGCEILESLDNRFQVNVTESGNPEPKTNLHLRISRATWGDYSNTTGWIYSYGEEDWFTNATAISRTKAGLTYCNQQGLGLSAMGFAWCYDASSPGVSGSYDPVYNTRWGGESINGPQGNRIWGLDANDYSLTGNSVCLDTYLNATQDYADYCSSQNLPTKIIFTTGPVDNVFQLSDGEVGYQQYLKYQRIRNYVNAQGNVYFLDFADILSYNNAGQQNTTSWKDNSGKTVTFPIIHDENYKDLNGEYDWSSGYHFGPQGALKIAKALWWLLARMSGWDGGGTTGINPLEGNKDDTGINIKMSDEDIIIDTNESFIQGKLALYNLNGCLLKELKIDSLPVLLNKTFCPPGLYFIVVSKSNLREVRKVAIIS